MKTLVNKTALVTGASRGIGRAISLALAEAGARVLVHYGRSKDEAEATASVIREKGGEAEILGSDLPRNGEVRVFEGQWNPPTVVVVEFPSLELAEAWYRSPEYAFALEVRDVALTRTLIVVDGYRAD